jgi:hypothetical protein
MRPCGCQRTPCAAPLMHLCQYESLHHRQGHEVVPTDDRTVTLTVSWTQTQPQHVATSTMSIRHLAHQALCMQSCGDARRDTITDSITDSISDSGMGMPPVHELWGVAPERGSDDDGAIVSPLPRLCALAVSA